MSALLDNPIVLALVVLAVGMLIFAVLKRLLKLALIFVIGLVAVSAYYAYTGQEAPGALQKIEDGVKNKVKSGAEKSKAKAKAIGDKVKDEVGKAARDEAKKAADTAKEEIEEAAEKVVDEALDR